MNQLRFSLCVILCPVSLIRAKTRDNWWFGTKIVICNFLLAHNWGAETDAESKYWRVHLLSLPETLNHQLLLNSEHFVNVSFLVLRDILTLGNSKNARENKPTIQINMCKYNPTQPCVWHHCKIETFHSSWATLLWLDKNLRGYKTNVVKSNSARKVWTQWLNINTHIQGGGLGVSLQKEKNAPQSLQWFASARD